MWTIIRTELAKQKRKRVTLVIFILTTLIPLLAFERACSISRGSNIMDSFGDLYTLAFKNLVTVYFPIVFGLFATSLFYDEHKNDTLKAILIIPISPKQLYFSKMALMFIFSIGLCLYTFVLTVLGGVLAGGFPDLNIRTISQSLILFVEGGMLIPLAMLPVVFLAVVGKTSYLLPIGATLLYVFPVIIMSGPLMGIHPLASALCIYGGVSPAASEMVVSLSQVSGGTRVVSGYGTCLTNIIVIAAIASISSVIALKKQNF